MRSASLFAVVALAVVLVLSSAHNAFAQTELYYDDGTSENYVFSMFVGARYAVRFSLPSGWSAASVVGVKFYTWREGSAMVHIYGSLSDGCAGVDLQSFSMNFNLNSWNEQTGLTGVTVTGDFCVAAEYTAENFPQFGLDSIVAPEVDPQTTWISEPGSATWSHLVFPSPPPYIFMIRAWVGPAGPAPVGGVLMPANTLALVAPWVAVIGLVGCIGTIVVVAKKPN